MKDVMTQTLDLSASERLALTQLLKRLEQDHSHDYLGREDTISSLLTADC